MLYQTATAADSVGKYKSIIKEKCFARKRYTDISSHLLMITMYSIIENTCIKSFVVLDSVGGVRLLNLSLDCM